MPKTPEVRKWTAAEGERLRRKRIEKGLSQSQATGILKITDDTLRNWERGATQPREGSLAALAEFSGCTIDELFEDLPAPAATPPIEESPFALAATSAPLETSPSPRVSRKRWPVIVAATTLALLGLTAFGAWEMRGRQFAYVRALPDGIAGVSRDGRTLWQVKGVWPQAANRWALVRMPGDKRVVACVLSRKWDVRPETVNKISLIDADADEFRVQTITLPDGSDLFTGYSRRYDMVSIAAVDLDDDGVDEMLVTYRQVPECVSYTILYEPKVDHSRLLFVHTGSHHFVGAYDIDGDGRRDVLFLGINNGYNWLNALAAVRVEPWVGTAMIPNEEAPVVSPDATVYYPNAPSLIFYAVLPRGRFPDDPPKAVSWDGSHRLLSVRLANGRLVTLTAGGFLPSDKSSLPEPQREVLRREAGVHDRESRRLAVAERFDDAVTEGTLAVAAAERSGDRILLEAMQRGFGKVLIGAGRTDEGDALLRSVASRSENASEIYYDAGVAHHLRGELDRAVEYYELGIGRGGSPEGGKDKHEFIQAEVLALVEKGAYDEALQAIDRFSRRYASQADQRPIYEEYVRWRRGQVPRPERIRLGWNPTDIVRYWMLEFRFARGDAPAVLLQEVETLLAEESSPKGALLSLKAALLDRAGDRAGAERLIAEAVEIGKREAKTSIIAQAHRAIVDGRRRTVGVH